MSVQDGVVGGGKLGSFWVLTGPASPPTRTTACSAASPLARCH